MKSSPLRFTATDLPDAPRGSSMARSPLRSDRLQLRQRQSQPDPSERLAGQVANRCHDTRIFRGLASRPLSMRLRSSEGASLTAIPKRQLARRKALVVINISH
jgi:hypothetical protein